MYGQYIRVSCASALRGFGDPVFTTVTVRCVPIVGVVLSVCWSFRCVFCGNASPWFVVCFMSTRGREACPSIAQHGEVHAVLLAISADAKEHDVVMSA